MEQNTLYEMICKRKSFHIFKDIQKISSSELQDVEEKYRTFKPLNSDIKTAIRIVPAQETTCKRGQEYCILFYSEKKDNYLQNIGYIGEQLDLYLASRNIGALWFGIGIFLYFLELCLLHDRSEFERTLFSDNGEDESEEVPAAVYRLK